MRPVARRPVPYPDLRLIVCGGRQAIAARLVASLVGATLVGHGRASYSNG
jgi:hypothetical protein